MWSDAVFARQARCDETLSESEFSHYERVREQLWRRVPLQVEIFVFFKFFIWLLLLLLLLLLLIVFKETC